MSGMRWVRLFVPSGRMQCELFGYRPVVIGEAPKGVGREVRLATDQEAGMFGRLAGGGSVRLGHRRLALASPLLTVLPESVLFTDHRGRTRLPSPIPPNLATVQHIDSRLSPLRGTFAVNTVERTTLYCHACNQADAREEFLRTPIDVLRARARNGHRDHPPTANSPDA